MNNRANYIKQRLSLREPLCAALDVIVRLSDALQLCKGTDINSILGDIKALYPTFSGFERDFPSFCFSIATGIGKTRLMGATIAYLYLEKGIRNFFVLAPNLTIYNKLIEDFGEPTNPKYVFNGIGEFVHNRPVIITGDNYASAGGIFAEKEIRINVFNISKFNKDATAATRGAEKGKLPKIKRLSEYLGQSYWEYLSKLDDLVILMDEAHRYKASASVAAINELKPVLGIELTATPLDEKGNPFKNIVYEYNLAQALADAQYVKNPAIAYRKNFQTQGKTESDIEMVKLEDAVSIHEETKIALEVFANNTGNKKVKPFILVVCKDTTHAGNILSYIKSNQFFQGQYANKVIQIDSSVSDEDNAELLATIEAYDNPIEIVIHVNMLAEGWDVTNLYTICPLRKADSIKLIEQTIGRGLRLPFKGERVGDEKADRLTVVAHDNFQKVIEAAQDENSILNRFSYVNLDDKNIAEKTQTVVTVSVVELEQQKAQETVNAIKDPIKKVKEQQTVDAKNAIIAALPTLNRMEGVNKIEDFNKPEIKEQVIQTIEDKLLMGQQNLFAKDIVEEAKAQYETVINQYKQHTIEIPRMDLSPDEIKTWFEDFDLDTSTGFDLKILEEEIQVRGLVNNELSIIGVRHGAHLRDTPANQIIAELMDFPEVDYDECSGLLQKLATQAIEKLQQQTPEESDLLILVRQYRKIIAIRIWEQMKKQFKQSEFKYTKPKVLPFTRIEPWSFSALANGGYKDFRLAVLAKDVTKYVFMGFEKSCHPQYKFDSSSEKILAQILEEDKDVLKWLRPAESQFRIYWAKNSRKYLPDFVVECVNCIYLVEVKAAGQLNQEEVLQKKKAAEEYCKYATEYNLQHGKKMWEYVIIPHDKIQLNCSFGYLVEGL